MTTLAQKYYLLCRIRTLLHDANWGQLRYSLNYRLYQGMYPRKYTKDVKRCSACWETLVVAIVSLLPCVMHEFNEPYFNLNRFLLKMLGLWPYQQTYFIQIHQGVFLSIFFMFLVAQLLVLYTVQSDLVFVLKILSFVFPIFVATVKYCIFIIDADGLKGVLERIREDWNLLKDKVEIDILVKYSWYTKIATIVAFVLCCGAILSGFTLQFRTLIFDILLPLNESRPIQPLVMTEYFINPGDYFYAKLLHQMLALYLLALAFCVISMTILSYILHGCALLRIVSCQMQSAIETDILAMPSPKKEYVLHRKIVHVVFVHQRATEFVGICSSSFTVSYDVLIITGVISLSVNLFRLITLTKDIDMLSETSIILGLMFIHLSYMFFGNFIGQRIIDRGAEVFQAIYNSPWYLAPLNTQKLILFMMQRGTIEVPLTFGSIFVASLEGFAVLISTAISYLTMIFSIR